MVALDNDIRNMDTSGTSDLRRCLATRESPCWFSSEIALTLLQWCPNIRFHNCPSLAVTTTACGCATDEVGLRLALHKGSKMMLVGDFQ